MRDHDETPYIVVERDSGGGLGSFILGALVGAGLALLFAPQSGEETQEEIKSRAVKLKDTAKERVREAQENLEGRLSTAREHVQARVDIVGITGRQFTLVDRHRHREGQGHLFLQAGADRLDQPGAGRGPEGGRSRRG